MYSIKKGNRFGLFFVANFILLSIIIEIIVKVLHLQITPITNIALSQLVLVFLPVILYFLITNNSIKNTLHLHKTYLSNIMLSFLVALFIIPLVMLVNVISQFFVSQALANAFTNIYSYDFRIVALTMAIFPAIFEECVTRGIMLSNFKFKNVYTASILSGLFFGIMHLNINQFIYALILGFIFAIVVHATGSILCSMVMHFTVNFVNVGLAFLPKLLSEMYSDNLKAELDASIQAASVNRTDALISSLQPLFILTAITLPIAILIIRLLININEKQYLFKTKAPSYMFFEDAKNCEETSLGFGTNTYEHTTETAIELAEKGNERIITIPFIITILLFIGMSILNEL